MADLAKIQFKRTSTAGTLPSGLSAGEFAMNITDKRLWSSDGTNLVEFGLAKGGTIDGTLNVSTGNITTTGGGILNQSGNLYINKTGVVGWVDNLFLRKDVDGTLSGNLTVTGSLNISSSNIFGADNAHYLVLSDTSYWATPTATYHLLNTTTGDTTVSFTNGTMSTIGSVYLSSDNSGVIVGNNSDIGLIKTQGSKGKYVIGSQNTFDVAVSASSTISPTDTTTTIFSIDTSGNITGYGSLTIPNAANFSNVNVSDNINISGSIQFADNAAGDSTTDALNLAGQFSILDVKSGSSTNYPESVGTLLSASVSTNRTGQMLFGSGTSNVWFRNLRSDATSPYGAWVQAYTTAFPPTASAVNAYSKTESDSRFASTAYFLAGGDVSAVRTNSNGVLYISSDGTLNVANSSGYTFTVDSTGTLIKGLIPISTGGTGATTASAARTNLGLGSGAITTWKLPIVTTGTTNPYWLLVCSVTDAASNAGKLQLEFSGLDNYGNSQSSYSIVDISARLGSSTTLTADNIVNFKRSASDLDNITFGTAYNSTTGAYDVYMKDSSGWQNGGQVSILASANISYFTGAINTGVFTTTTTEPSGISYATIKSLGSNLANGSTSIAGEFISTNANGLRIASNTSTTSSSFIIRNDGGDMYFMVSNNGITPGNNWNTLRPLTMNMTTGDIQLGSALGVGTSLSVSGTTYANTINATQGNFNQAVSAVGLSSSSGLNVSSGSTSVQGLTATSIVNSGTLTSVGITSSSGLTVSSGTTALKAVTSTSIVNSGALSSVGLSSSSGLTVSSGSTSVQGLTATSLQVNGAITTTSGITAPSAQINGNINSTGTLVANTSTVVTSNVSGILTATGGITSNGGLTVNANALITGTLTTNNNITTPGLSVNGGIIQTNTSQTWCNIQGVYTGGNAGSNRQVNGIRFIGNSDIRVDIYEYENIGSNHGLNFHVYGGGSDGYFTFYNSGAMSASGAITSGGGITAAGGILASGGNVVASGNLVAGNGSSYLQSDGNVYGNVWNGYLNNYISSTVNNAVMSGAGQVGSYTFASVGSSTQNSNSYGFGATIAGSSLYVACITASMNWTDDVAGIYTNATLSGTWMCMGYLTASGSNNHGGATLWQRIS